MHGSYLYGQCDGMIRTKLVAKDTKMSVVLHCMAQYSGEGKGTLRMPQYTEERGRNNHNGEGTRKLCNCFCKTDLRKRVGKVRPL
jgi:hypothetical protein